MRRNIKSVLASLVLVAVCVMEVSCTSAVNTVGDPRFSEDGRLLKDTTDTARFVPALPKRVKFYVEVSGSMNGYFRADCATGFKRDVWNIMSYFSGVAPSVNILTNDGGSGAEMPLGQFKQYMNTGAFVSSASTKVPLMLESIISGLDTQAGEVAVLVSDMKYSPVGAAAPSVLLSQYSTDVSRILGGFGKAVCLVCAVSDYLDQTGNDVAGGRSPYYYLIMGGAEQVAMVRNKISSLLEDKGTFVENIESGFDYGRPAYSFGIPRNCEQLDDEPTFVDCIDDDPADSCIIRLKVSLENYRWLLADSTVFREAFRAKALHGSTVTVGGVHVETRNITDRELNRKSTATVELKIGNIVLDSDVIEWTLELPDTRFGKMAPFFINATEEGDPTRSFSVEDFLKGLFGGGLVNKELGKNYILVSKKG